MEAQLMYSNYTFLNIPIHSLPLLSVLYFHVQDNVLPKSIVTRLSKGVLPQNTNIQKDAVLALTKGATVFINYLCAT